MSNTKVLGALFLSSMLWGCGYTPIPFEGRDAKGPGLFTGNRGAFVLLGQEETPPAHSVAQEPASVKESVTD